MALFKEVEFIHDAHQNPRIVDSDPSSVFHLLQRMRKGQGVEAPEEGHIENFLDFVLLKSFEDIGQFGSLTEAVLLKESHCRLEILRCLLQPLDCQIK